MNAPNKVTPERFNELVDDFLSTASFENGSEVVHKLSCSNLGKLTNEACDCPIEKRYCCRGCGSDIHWTRTYMSLHDATWGSCAGYGDVCNPTMPFCPRCEPKVNIFGCVHPTPIAGSLTIKDPGKFVFTPDAIKPSMWQRIATRFGL